MSPGQLGRGIAAQNRPYPRVMNLLVYLMTEFLARDGRPSGSALDVDARLHELDTLLVPLDQGSALHALEEAQVLAAYLDLPAEDLDALPPLAHEWFAERLSIATALPDRPRLAERIARVYFVGGEELHHYLAVAALLALDARVDAID